MNKIAKRLVAGASAAALLVSAVGVDQLADLFMKTSYAIYNSKTARSTGFPNLEQDTDSDNNYNTGYGLHTNKTATEVKNADGTTDGRTFDVNLESWYVGENPVDVATILDASGSMAWTVDTLEPLEIEYKALEEYEIKNKDDLIALQNKPENGGYLPQEIVDKILKPEKTDNSKLSYADYMYYIYESRSTVSEFVPLGYWNGGKTAEKFSPIGYYPFEGTLDNAIDSLTDTKATLIAHPGSSSSFDETEITTVPASPTYSNGFVNLNTTAKNGAIALDVPLKSRTHQLSIVFDMQISDIGSSGDPYDETPILYISDGKSNSSYLRIVKGNKRASGSAKGAAQKIRCYDSSDLQPSSASDGSAVNESNSKRILDSDSDFAVGKTYTVTYTFNFDTKQAYLYYYKDGTLVSKSGNIQNNFDFDSLQILVGGNICADKDNYRDTYIKNLKIYNSILSSSGATSSDILIASYALDGSATSLVDSVNGKTAKLVEQVQFDGYFNVEKILEDVPANVTYTSTKYKGNKALNLSETSKLGGILLDAKLTNDSRFTLSFAVRKDGKDTEPNAENILYIGGMKDTNKYYQVYRASDKSANRLKMSKKGSDYVNINNIFSDSVGYKFITIVVDGKKVEQYVDGKEVVGSNELKEAINEYITDEKDLSLILGELWDGSYNGADILIDDLYIFDDALDEEQVKLVAENAGKTEFAILPSALSGSGTCGGYHATTSDGTDIAQISESLAQNPEDGERKGWYYVNSHSNWADISGCLESGKQYLGIINDFGLATYKDGITPDKLAPNGSGSGDVIKPEEGYADDNRSIATVPSVYQAAYDDYEKATATNPDIKPDEALGSTERAKYLEYYKNLTKGNDSTRTFTPAENERSLQFYIDNYGYLRCFYCTGDYSWKVSSSKWSYNPRTFCSVVYVKEKYEVDKRIKGDKDYGNPTKYEELNYALNQFYQNLAKYSDLSNSAIVRFSTHNLIQGNSKDEVETNAVDHLKMLIMKDWTNWSDKYIDSNKELTYDKYLQDLLIPTADETSIRTENSSARPDILEYPYVMTGGTYTWTGLKAFYDNMVNTDKLSSGDTVYNIANDARDKYLIIFTDGRDNLVDNTKDKKYVTNFGYKDGNAKKGVEYYGNFAPYYNGVQKNLNYDSELAKAWADKLKDEGYTIFCVMLATGSISPTTNEEEYNKAYDFLETLAGDKDGERDVDDCISVVGVDNTLEAAFADILTKIQQPRADYTVQDYIDPRFDLVDASGNLYKLGAGGKITIEKTDGSSKTKTVGNIIDSIDEGTTATGLAYTPLESHMVNRTSSTDTTGDDVGTGYIYYDDEKDMYYLRWTKQIIPMENRSFDTDKLDDYVDGKPKYLDVWSATIQLKAKDDFIGGNNILTNGNEAGENLVYSDATIENMDKGTNYTLYGFTDTDLNSEGKVPYRKKLEALSGTDRKINAVDAGGVSQAVYGNGIDIPSSGFPRTTVNVRLLPLNANNLNDVIYMGEVVSPTMMLADLENGYMTGSYYLEYLERYAYRVYGDKADSMPLIELLNKWLKINEKEEEAKTFTIPYIYLPDPEYDENGKLARDTATNKVNIQNSTGASWNGTDIDFADLNLRDVTGFITYTWKREDVDINGNGTVDKGDRESQQVDSGTDKYDITKDYVVKNTNQIKYNLQLTFTPLKEGELPTGFSLGDNFISEDKFFTITDGEFADSTEDKWTITPDVNSNRTDYLQAMIQEKRTYTPHVMYDTKQEKWVLVDEKSDDFKAAKAVAAYVDNDVTKQTENAGDGKVTDSGVYDWTPDYKPASGKAQLEGGTSDDDVKNIKGYYTDTPDNVKLLDATGKTELTDDDGKVTGTDPVSLAANTTYTKDVVNAALALELFVDGKYLNTGSLLNPNTGAKTFEFIATRYYDDPIDPLPYGGTVNASTDVAGQKYKLTFKVNELPKNPQSNEIYRVWAILDEVWVEDSTEPSGYKSIKDYGYADINALPIGTYVIDTVDNPLATDNFKIANKNDTAGITENLYFKYLKIDNDKNSFTHDRFPDTVSGVSTYAATDTKDGEYLIWNNGTNTDHSKENIAENNREKTTDKQTVTFYFGTVAEKKVGTETLNNTKGVSAKDYLKENPEDTELSGFTNDYAKDRLGIIMLSADDNSLAITKKVKNNKDAADLTRGWEFTVTVTPDKDDEVFGTNESVPLDLKWYKLVDDNWVLQTTPPTGYDEEITFTKGSDNIYTATIYLKHDEKVVIDGLPEGTWQVTEDLEGVFCTPHNDQFTYGEDEWQYNRADSTRADIDLTPASQVNYINEFPYELPSAGGSGTVRYILLGTLLTALGALLFAVLYFDRRKKARR